MRVHQINSVHQIPYYAMRRFKLQEELIPFFSSLTTTEFGCDAGFDLALGLILRILRLWTRNILQVLQVLEQPKNNLRTGTSFAGTSSAGPVNQIERVQYPKCLHLVLWDQKMYIEMNIALDPVGSGDALFIEQSNISVVPDNILSST